MAIERITQEKMTNYNLVLAGRYTPGITYFKLTAGSSKSGDAISDTTIVSAVYIGNDRLPDINSVIKIDQNKLLDYNGDDLWYHVFSSSSTDLNLIILISTRGIVTDKITF